MKTKTIKEARMAIEKLIDDKQESVKILEVGIKEAYWYIDGLKDALKALEESHE